MTDSLPHDGKPSGGSGGESLPCDRTSRGAGGGNGTDSLPHNGKPSGGDGGESPPHDRTPILLLIC